MQSTKLKSLNGKKKESFERYDDERRPTARKAMLTYRISHMQTKANQHSCSSTDYCVEGFAKNVQFRLLSGQDSPQAVNIMPSHQLVEKRKESSLSKTLVTPTIIQIRLSESQTSPFLQRHIRCLYMSPKNVPTKMTRGTQTLYRESSMQTLPYLPDVSNSEEILKTLELFKLPQILKGDGPPGLFEVKVLERARKRWAFEKAIKDKFECALKEARSDAERKKVIPNHKAILEAFEWESWLQREEVIQGYQMMRFQLVLRLFEKREHEMHKAATNRIQQRCEDIVQRRDKALLKNDIAFGRTMRRLKIKHEMVPRNWRKEKISNQLGDPSSEYYAPKMRYGVNPNRRHFQHSRKAFEMRMEDLGKRSVNMKNLKCPFAKLKEWSTPKVQVPEVEPNFCTETHLQKLYEGLKNLREQSKKQKIIPKCLVEKARPQSLVSEEPNTKKSVLQKTEEFHVYETEQSHQSVQVGPRYFGSTHEMTSQRNNQSISIPEMLDERRCEEIESMLAEYEGSQIGWLMRFLSEEMCRLEEQRKLHFITMLALKERWRREAAEAGLRQKENEMRKIYEDIFDEADNANREVCDQYLDNIFGFDTLEQADFDAKSSTAELARLIDVDLQRWLCSFESIQNPLNYDCLRQLLHNLVFPETIAECLIRKYESQSVVDYIINDVLFGLFDEFLEPYDICTTLTNNLVDRLIDNDLYVFSSEYNSSCDCNETCGCKPKEKEAKSIIRKLIRHTVPGRRWRTENELIAYENVKDIVYDTCNALTADLEPEPSTISSASSKLDLLMNLERDKYDGRLSQSSTDQVLTQTVTVTKYRKAKNRREPTEGLVNIEHLLFDDSSSSESNVQTIERVSKSRLSESIFVPVSLRPAISTFNMQAHPATSHGTLLRETDLDISEQVIKKTALSFYKLERSTESFLHDIINQSINSIFPEELTEALPEEFPEEFPETVSKKEVKRTTQIKQISDTPTKGVISFTTDDVVRASLDSADGKVTAKPKVYEMVLSQGQLEKMLCDDGECKCQMEIDYRNHIRELYESGKIKIINKQNDKTSESDTVQPNVAELIFEYMTSSEDTKEGKLIESREELQDEPERPQEEPEERPPRKVSIREPEVDFGLENVAQTSEETEVNIPATVEESEANIEDIAVNAAETAGETEPPKAAEGVEETVPNTSETIETTEVNAMEAAQGIEVDAAATDVSVIEARDETVPNISETIEEINQPSEAINLEKEPITAPEEDSQPAENVEVIVENTDQDMPPVDDTDAMGQPTDS